MSAAAQSSNGSSAVDRTGFVAIFGAGGHAVSVADVAKAAGFQVTHFIAAGRAGHQLLGLPIIDDVADIDDLDATRFAVAIGDNAVREAVSRDLLCRFGAERFPILTHPSASVSTFSTIGIGTVLMPHSNVGSNCKVGRFCILNSGSSIDHDGRMADYASLAPGVVTGGAVTIGTRSAISIGAAVMNRVCIGDDCVVGGMSFVNRDVQSHQVVYGAPARFIRERKTGDPYL